MSKSIWEITDDGAPCELYGVEELSYQKVIDNLSEREAEIFGDLCYDGWIFVLEGNNDKGVWDQIGEGAKIVTFEFLLNRIKQIIKEELAYKGEV